MDVSTSVYVVNVRNDVRVFSTFEKALAFVSKHNNKVDRCFTFSQEDKQMYDAMMEEHLGNVWADTAFYEQWRETRMKELDIIEQDVENYTYRLFIQGVEVE